MLEHLKLKHGVDISGEARAMARVSRAAEAAKRQLSDHPFARVQEEYLTERDGATSVPAITAPGMAAPRATHRSGSTSPRGSLLNTSIKRRRITGVRVAPPTSRISSTRDISAVLVDVTPYTFGTSAFEAENLMGLPADCAELRH
jgi:molecular chaperone DnaK